MPEQPSPTTVGITATGRITVRKPSPARAEEPPEDRKPT